MNTLSRIAACTAVAASSMFGFVHTAGAVVGVVEAASCYTLVEEAMQKEGTITTYTIYDADGDVVISGSSNDDPIDNYAKAKESSASLPLCEAAATPIAAPGVAALMLGLGAPTAVLARRRARKHA